MPRLISLALPDVTGSMAFSTSISFEPRPHPRSMQRPTPPKTVSLGRSPSRPSLVCLPRADGTGRPAAGSVGNGFVHGQSRSGRSRGGRSRGNPRQSWGARRRTGRGHSWGRSPGKVGIWERTPRQTGTRTEKRRPTTQRAGRTEARPAARQADRETKKPPAGTAWGGWREVGPGREVRSRCRTENARRRSAGGVEGGLPPLAACTARADILHGAPVIAPAAGVSHRRNPLSGRRLDKATPFL